MNLLYYIENKNYSYSVTTPLRRVKSELERQGFLVVREREQVAGIVTLDSIMDREYAFLADCLSEDYLRLDVESSLEEALERLRTENKKIALCYWSDGRYAGVVMKERLEGYHRLYDEQERRIAQGGSMALAQLEVENRKLRNELIGLRRQQRTLEEVFYSNPMPMLLIDKALVIREANQVWGQWLNLSHQELVGKTLEGLFTPHEGVDFTDLPVDIGSSRYFLASLSVPGEDFQELELCLTPVSDPSEGAYLVILQRPTEMDGVTRLGHQFRDSVKFFYLEKLKHALEHESLEIRRNVEILKFLGGELKHELERLPHKDTSLRSNYSFLAHLDGLLLSQKRLQAMAGDGFALERFEMMLAFVTQFYVHWMNKSEISFESKLNLQELSRLGLSQEEIGRVEDLLLLLLTWIETNFNVKGKSIKERKVSLSNRKPGRGNRLELIVRDNGPTMDQVEMDRFFYAVKPMLHNEVKEEPDKKMQPLLKVGSITFKINRNKKSPGNEFAIFC